MTDQEQSGGGIGNFLNAIDRTTGNIKPDAKPAENKEEAPPAAGEEKPNGETPQANQTPPAEEGDKNKPSEGQPAAKPAETATPPKEVDLDEVLKKADRKEIAKKLGLDEFDIDFADYRKKGGDPLRYLEAKTRDWVKIPDADVLLHDLRQQFPGMDPEEFELLAEKRVHSRFNQDFATEKEKKVALLELKIEADSLRKKYAEEDSKFVIPEKEADTQQAEMQAAIERAKQDFIDSVNDSEITKQLLTGKKLTAGEGEELLNIEVNPEQILDKVVNEGKFFTIFNDDKGQIDLQKLYKAINYAMNMQAYEKSLIDYGKSLGTKAESDEIHNIPKEQPPKAGDKRETLSEAFAKRGKEVTR